MEFSERLRQLMDEHRETKYRLAKTIGVHQSTVAKWLNGTAYPQYRHIEALENHYQREVIT